MTVNEKLIVFNNLIYSEEGADEEFFDAVTELTVLTVHDSFIDEEDYGNDKAFAIATNETKVYFQRLIDRLCV